MQHSNIECIHPMGPHGIIFVGHGDQQLIGDNFCQVHASNGDPEDNFILLGMLSDGGNRGYFLLGACA